MKKKTALKAVDKVVESKVQTFDDFNLDEKILSAIKKKGFEKPSEIQAKVIPLALERKNDIVGVSQTGTGKTAAFGLPIVSDLSCEGVVKAIVLAPTRELAIQVTDEMRSFSKEKKLRFLTVYGGSNIDKQIRELNEGVDVVVGTCGRVIDLLQRGKLNLSQIEYIVLDEADEMLKMGFIEDIEKILAVSNKKRRTLLFSATMPPRIKSLTKQYMKKQVFVETKTKSINTDLIEQFYVKLKYSQKIEKIQHIIDGSDFFYGIIFCRTKADVEDVTLQLKRMNYRAECIHGDIVQSKRERILNRFKKLKINVLVATDVAARGIDVDNLSHVINHSLPREQENYVHRIGRTGRAGNSGVAISFVTNKEKPQIYDLEDKYGFKFKEDRMPTKSEMFEVYEKKFDVEFKDFLKNNKSNNNFSKKLLEKYDSVDLVGFLLNKLDNSNVESNSSNMDNRANLRDRDFDRRSNRSSDRRNGDRRSNDRNDRRGSRRGSSNLTRLFVAKGKMDNFGKRELFNFLEKKANISRLDGEDVKVLDKFSFVSVSDSDAKKIVKAFTGGKSSRRPLVEIASK
jgi:ATP-dependent RNA helicase DeaD